MNQPEIIPREVFFGNPGKIEPQISPDGKYLSYIAPDEGVLNIWLRTIGKDDDKPVTHDRGRGIVEYFWAPNGNQILYIQDRDGDENWRIFSVPISGGKPTLLTPLDKVKAEIIMVNMEIPDEILIGLNDRDPQLHDVYRLNLRTGAMKLEAKNDFGVIRWTADNQLHVRIAMVPLPDGGMKLMHRRSNEEWKELLHWGIEDTNTTGVAGFTKDDKHIRLMSSVGVNTSEYRLLNTETGEMRTIASDPDYDVSNLLIHPKTLEVEAICFNKDRLDWHIIDKAVQVHFDVIRMLSSGDIEIVDRDNNDTIWLVKFLVDNGPVSFFAYNTQTGKSTFLFYHRPELHGLQLAEMQPVTYTARDGLQIHGYLSLPSGHETKHLPTVMNIHGGPWARDEWRFNPEVQWLTNRGYAVMQINYRGSTGYGKKFLKAGDREWGGKMQDDITDAVNWLIEKGIADPKRIAIYGGSYGGYATLSGITKTPDLYACGIDMVGPSNLFSFLQSIPPYWELYRTIMEKQIGHPEIDADLLREHSPLFHIDKIKCPLLIAQGANDPRVSRAESLQIRDAMIAAGLKVEYLEFENEGHGFARPENRLKFYEVTEKFLAEHLGGRAERTV